VAKICHSAYFGSYDFHAENVQTYPCLSVPTTFHFKRTSLFVPIASYLLRKNNIPETNTLVYLPAGYYPIRFLIGQMVKQ